MPFSAVRASAGEMSSNVYRYQRAHSIILKRIYRKQDHDGKSLTRAPAGLERWTMLALAALPLLMPGTYLRTLIHHISNYWIHDGQEVNTIYGDKVYVSYSGLDWYTAVKPIVFLGLLVSGVANTTPLVSFVAGWFILDVWAYVLGQMLLSDYYAPPRSPRRSLISLFVNAVEVILAFAVLYSQMGVVATTNCPQTGCETLHSWPSALYLSAMTASTVGFGDVIPSPDDRFIVIWQVAILFSFKPWFCPIG